VLAPEAPVTTVEVAEFCGDDVLPAEAPVTTVEVAEFCGDDALPLEESDVEVAAGWPD